MSGAVEGVARIKLDADGEAMVCTGCGTTRTVAAIVADSATAFTCCPERKMIPARTMWHAWCDANDARPALTTPPARSYADGVDFRALLIEAGRNAGAYIDDRASDDFLKCIPEEVRLKIAALLSQGGKADM